MHFMGTIHNIIEQEMLSNHFWIMIWNVYFRSLVKSAYQKINFLISQPKVLKRTVSKHMLSVMGRKYLQFYVHFFFF